MPGDVECLADFQRVMESGRDVISEVPADRWDLDKYWHPDPHHVGTHANRRAGFMKNVHDFDHTFFNTSPREAANTDVQQRHLLEVTQEALDDAGIPSNNLPRKTGVYIGIGLMDMGFTVIEEAKCMNPYTHTGTGHSVAANRISYFYDIRGPSVAIDTACAASLTAMHYACFALWNKECPLAIVGGCNTLMVPEVTVGFSALGVLAPDGKSCPFSANAQGYVRSEGIGVVLLEPLSNALANNHHVHCVIKGSWLGHNGYSLSITMPSTDAQADLMRETYGVFNLPMDEIDFVEAHGTGTPVGDPIEAEAIAQAFTINNPRRKQPLLVGSGKSHFGHLECAAGMNQITKIVLMLQNKVIYPNINFGIENPKIDCKGWNIKIPEEVVPYTNKDKKFQIGVNTFGFGGALAHMIFEEYIDARKDGDRHGHAGWQIGNSPKRGKQILIPFSAKSTSALKSTATKWLDFENDFDAQEVACWLATRRSHYNNRLCIMADSGEDLRSKFQSYVDKVPLDEVVEGTLPVHKEENNICFVFPGQGQQSFHMGRTLYKEEPTFKAAIDACDAIYKVLSGHSFLEHTKLFIPLDDIIDYDETIVDEIHISQPAILFLQVGMFKLLEYWGISPKVVIGHSLGEVAASYACGALTLQEAVTVQYNRAQQQARVAGSGAMAALRVTPEEGWKICKKFDDLYVACINAPESITLAGGTKDIERLCSLYHEQAKQIRVKCAFHTSHMDLLCKEFLSSMKGKLHNGKSVNMAMYSTVTGTKFEEPCDAKYCWDNIREQVKFSPAVECILEDYKNVVFVELSGSATLLGCVRQTCKYVNEQPSALINCGQRQKDDRITMLRAVSSLHTMGVDINWNNMLGDCAKYMPLPRYAWQHQTFRYEAEGMRSRRLALEDLTYNGLHGQLKLESLLFLKDHIINGSLEFPPSGFVEYMAQYLFPVEEFPHLMDIKFENKKLIIPEDIDLNGVQPERIILNVSTTTTTSGKNICVSASDQIYATATTLNSRNIEDVPVSMEINIDIYKDACLIYKDTDTFYNSLTQFKIQYEDIRKFKHVRDFYLGDGQSVAYLYPVVEKRERLQTVTLDAAITVALATRPIDLPYKVASVDEIQMHVASLQYKDELVLITHVTHCDSTLLTVDVYVCNLSGRILVSIKGLSAEYKNTSQLSLSNLYEPIEQSYSASLPTIKDAQQLFSFEYLKMHYPYDIVAIETAEPYLPLVRQICAMYAKYGVHNCTATDVHPKMERYYKRLMQMSVECDIENVTPLMIKEQIEFVNRKSPEMRLEMDMINRMGIILPETLKDPRVGLTELFQEEMMGAYFIDSITTRIYYKVIGDIVKKATEFALEKKKIIRVLEIGGRLGGLTRHIVDSIAQHIKGSTVDYTFTDINITFFDMVREKFKDFSNIKYEQFDPESDGKSQNFSPNSYDIIVCLDTLHCTENASGALSNIKDLISNDGWLIVMESTFNHNTPEIIFGVFDLCWIFEDSRTDRCWMSQQEWLKCLNDVGFQETCVMSTPNEFFHSLIIGRNVISDQSEVYTNIDRTYVLINEQSMTNKLTLKNLLQITCNDLDSIHMDHYTDMIYCVDKNTTVDTMFRIVNTCESKEIRTLWIIFGDRNNNLNMSAIEGLLSVLQNEKKENVEIHQIFSRTQFDEVVQTVILNHLHSEKNIHIKNNELYTTRIRNYIPENYQPKKKDSWKLIQSEAGYTFQETNNHVLPTGVCLKLSSFSSFTSLSRGPYQYLCAVGSISDGIQLSASEAVLVVGVENIRQHINIPFTECIKIPSHFSSQEAASSCLPYSIANYILNNKLSVSKKDTLLVTNVCTPIGMAVLNLIKRQNTQIYCFVESDEQRQFIIRSYEVKQCFIYNTCSAPNMAFMNEVTCVVNCNDIDYFVLQYMKNNSQYCNIFINEVNHVIPANILSKNISIHSVSLRLLLSQKTEFIQIVRDAMEIVTKFKMPSITYHLLTVDDLMQSNNKEQQFINDVIDVYKTADIITCQPRSDIFDMNSSYYLIGDISDVLLELAVWIYEHGGRFIILLSNTRPKTWLEKNTIRQLEKKGVTMKVIECDIKCISTLTSLINNVTQNGAPPIKGIFTFNPIDAFHYIGDNKHTIQEEVFDKVKSVLNINIAIDQFNINLDYFVILTSASSVWGCPGTAVQTASDHILAELIRTRKALGKPGLCLQCGWLKGVQWQKKSEENDETKDLEKLMKPIESQCHIRDLLNILHQLLARTDAPAVVCATLEVSNGYVLYAVD